MYMKLSDIYSWNTDLFYYWLSFSFLIMNKFYVEICHIDQLWKVMILKGIGHASLGDSIFFFFFFTNYQLYQIGRATVFCWQITAK